jgi:HEAT repeat protein
MVALTIVLALVGGIAIVVYSVWNHLNPVYQGQRVFTWVEQAIEDEDPAARRRATDVLVAALRERQGDIRNQVIRRFCKRPLPKEVLPLLLEALRFKEIATGGYTAMALSGVEVTEAVPALVGVLENEADPETRARAIAALGYRGPWAEAAVPALRAALDDANDEVRRQARSALIEIGSGKSGKAGGR